MSRFLMVLTMVFTMFSTSTVTALCAGAGCWEDPRTPVLDKQGRLYIYSNGPRGLPFVPYGWMPKEAADMAKVDLECKTDPYVTPSADGQTAKPSPADNCIAVTVDWKAPYWCGVAWISGPDKWWGENNKGTHYDLANLKKKRLVFFARSPQTTKIQVKFGILTDKPFGDSVQIPPETKWLELTPQWKRYELSLADLSAKELKKICTGFVFVLSQDQQPKSNTPQTRFYLDEIYLD